MHHFFANIFRNRRLIREFISRDLRGRYAGTSLGSLWNLLNPLIMILVYTLVFSQILSAKLGVEDFKDNPWIYSIYLCSALLPWTFFADILGRSPNLYIEHGNLLKKIAFPPEILNVYIIGSAGTILCISLALFGIFFAFKGPPITFLAVLAYLAVIGLMLVTVFGLGLIVATLNVFFRDINQFVYNIVILWFWFTPIVWTKWMFSPFIQKLLYLNPMFHFTDSLQNLILFSKLPPLREWLLMILIAGDAFIIGYKIYGRFKSDIPDEI